MELTPIGYSANGEKFEHICKCGQPATALVMGNNLCIHLCHNCQFGEDFKAAKFIYRPNPQEKN